MHHQRREKDASAVPTMARKRIRIGARAALIQACGVCISVTRVKIQNKMAKIVFCCCATCLKSLEEKNSEFQIITLSA